MFLLWIQLILIFWYIIIAIIPNKLPNAKIFCGPNKSKKTPAINPVKAITNCENILFEDKTVALICLGINLWKYVWIIGSFIENNPESIMNTIAAKKKSGG